ncbi:unnamed protein product [Cercopithifilaria johnstoni]|uniref:Uncharacterized protein n=1 Tax=Cercopithifilaria johnstoni TaxID=2874296 RepID=A0A8J2LZS8_9BILA|nr:unnamed protein product [Cercopithifilaria johnstoni]
MDDIAIVHISAQPKVEKIQNILAMDDFIITDLNQEIMLKEIDDLSDLGDNLSNLPEVKRTVRMFSTSSIFYHIAICCHIHYFINICL